MTVRKRLEAMEDLVGRAGPDRPAASDAELVRILYENPPLLKRMDAWVEAHLQLAGLSEDEADRWLEEHPEDRRELDSIDREMEAILKRKHQGEVLDAGEDVGELGD